MPVTITSLIVEKLHSYWYIYVLKYYYCKFNQMLNMVNLKVTTLPLFNVGPHSISIGKYSEGVKQQAGILVRTSKGKATILQDLQISPVKGWTEGVVEQCHQRKAGSSMDWALGCAKLSQS